MYKDFNVIAAVFFIVLNMIYIKVHHLYGGGELNILKNYVMRLSLK